MKKIVFLLLLSLLLSGCDAVSTWETLGSVDHVSPTQAQLRQVMLTLPEDAALEVNASDLAVTVYSCDGYLICLQTFPSGDLSGTVRSLSGFSPEALTMVESACYDHQRYDWVWTAVAEEGELVCRGTVLDDGNHQYTLCAMALSEDAGALQAEWNSLFGSFCLES